MEKKLQIKEIKNEKDKYKIEKQIIEKIDTDLFINLVISILIITYFAFINLGYINIDVAILNKDLEVFCLVFLFIGLFLIEKAYKKESGKITLYAIEILIFAFHTLTINHFVTIYNLDFQAYVLTSSYIFSIYYILKCIIIYTIAKRKYLKNLSDIHEIIKQEPTKKEAKKRIKEEGIKK